MQAEGVRLLGIGEPAAAVEAFEESQRSFRRAGMKNAGVSPVRPWLLTALLRDAEATPRWIGAGEPPSSDGALRRSTGQSTCTLLPQRPAPRAAGARAPGGAERAAAADAHARSSPAASTSPPISGLTRRRSAPGSPAVRRGRVRMDGVRRRRGAGGRRASSPHRGGCSRAQDRRCHVGGRRRGPGRRVALPRARDDRSRRGDGCTDRQPIDVPRAHPLGPRPERHGHPGSSRILHGFSPIRRLRGPRTGKQAATASRLLRPRPVLRCVESEGAGEPTPFPVPPTRIRWFTASPDVGSPSIRPQSQ